MSALVPILVCGGGCLAVCWFMMGRTHRPKDNREPDQSARGPSRSGDTDEPTA